MVQVVGKVVKAQADWDDEDDGGGGGSSRFLASNVGW